jgi:RNA polymerase sigma-70 factor (ECF subfamily)
VGNEADYIELVRKAQLGDKECLNRLSELARERLRVFVYRFALQDDLTQDIVQESMLEMFKILGKLKRADRFWPWLYGIALNKMHRHYRTERRQRAVSASEMADAGAQKDKQEGLENLIGQELKQIVAMAMRGVKPRHRAVLCMRCYDEMSYSEIAESLGCSEFATRMLFYRAKRALQKQLSRQGFGKGSLLTALVLFGKMTAPSEAAAAQVSVAAATTKVGVLAGLVGTATSKTTVLCLATAGVLSIGTLVATSEPDTTTGVYREKPTASSHVTSRMGRAGRINEEYWYFFPEGKDGPMMTRLMRRGPKGRRYYCWRMQDEEANYYINKRKNTVRINNYRLWCRDLSVWRLPTDNAKFREFLSQIEGGSEEIEYVSGDTPGLMLVVSKNKNGSSCWTTRHYHVLKEEYFRYSWPTGAKVIDDRDAMHKRGWTYFKLDGEMNGEEVSGVGQIPFVYAASKANNPWVRLKVGSRLKIVDNGENACVYDGSGKVVAGYEGGSFFKGLTRPWMGLHTIDTVRRDAAEKQVWFETKYKPRESKAEVVLTPEQGKLVYTIDMEKDVIDKIAFSTSDGREGELRFSYLQDIDEAGNEFVEPRIKRSYRSKQRASPGMLWLLWLAE